MVWGEIDGKIMTCKTRPDFLQFMDKVVAGHPPDLDIHVILDNKCIHKKNDDWRKDHFDMFFSFHTGVSQLAESSGNPVRDHVLKGAARRHLCRHLGTEAAVERYIAAHDQGARPFLWKKREVAGSQLTNTIAELCN